MKNLQEATERICELKGSQVALDALVPAVIEALSAPARARLMASFDAHAEAARTSMLHADISDAVLQAFDETHLEAREEMVAIGDALTIVGFPLGLHDTVHHLAVTRNAFIASAYGIRFRQQGCFLTDARTHRGSSGSPVVRRRANDPSAAAAPSWQLLGVHSTRMDMRTRDQAQDDSLGLNRAWYADVLTALTRDLAGGCR